MSARRCAVCGSITRRSDDHRVCDGALDVHGFPVETPTAGVLRLAKAQVERWHGINRLTDPDRRWLGPVSLDSYASPDYRTSLWTLEGSPPRGSVLVLHDGDALAISSDGRQRRLFRVWVLEALRRPRPLARHA
jgi:hypothetical protein